MAATIAIINVAASNSVADITAHLPLHSFRCFHASSLMLESCLAASTPEGVNVFDWIMYGTVILTIQYKIQCMLLATSRVVKREIKFYQTHKAPKQIPIPSVFPPETQRTIHNIM